MRQAGARLSQERAVSWERLAPAWRMTEMGRRVLTRLHSPTVGPPACCSVDVCMAGRSARLLPMSALQATPMFLVPVNHIPRAGSGSSTDQGSLPASYQRAAHGSYSGAYGYMFGL